MNAMDTYKCATDLTCSCVGVPVKDMQHAVMCPMCKAHKA